MNVSRKLFAAFLLVPLAAAATEPDSEAVEFYNTTLNHYFITATADEAKSIDVGAAGPGWVRTGRSFQVWLDKRNAPGSASGVCRFYSSGANSHFYTASADECAYLRGLEASERASGAPVRGWQYESTAFNIEIPSGASCPAGSSAIYRVYNNGFATGDGANHRYVDDSDLRALMVDRSWVAEGIAFCSRTKSTGSSANIPPTSSDFAALAGTWSGSARWERELAGVETYTTAALSLAISADGTVSGSGNGCAFAGRVSSGDGFRSLFSGSVSANGCANSAFNGAYTWFQIERFSDRTLAVRFKRGDNADEASVEAMLTSPSTPTPVGPTPTPAAGGIIGNWAGTVGWELVRKAGGASSYLITSNRALQLTIDSAGAFSGSGFGCTIAGSVQPAAVAGLFLGTAVLTGCAEAGFSGTYAEVKVKRDDAKLEVELEKETSSSDGSTLKASVEGYLAGGSSGAVDPPPPPTPSNGIAGDYAGGFTAEVKVRDRSNGRETTTTTSLTGQLSFGITPAGSLSGSGLGCQWVGSLSLVDAASQTYKGTVTGSACALASLNGAYKAEAHPESGSRLELELERESEVGNVKTEVKVSGKGTRAGN